VAVVVALIAASPFFFLVGGSRVNRIVIATVTHCMRRSNSIAPLGAARSFLLF